MGSDLNLGFDAGNDAGGPVFWLLATVRSDPAVSPADEVGGKGCELLLQPKCRGCADLEVMHLEDRFAFFDARFNGLPVIVGGEPGGQVCGDPLPAKVHQAAMADRRAGVKPLQRHIERVRTGGQVLVGPGHHLGIVADDRPCSGRYQAIAAGVAVLMGLGIDVIAQFNQQGDIVTGAKACIQAEDRLHRCTVGGVVVGEACQALLEEVNIMACGGDQFALAVDTRCATATICCWRSTWRCLVTTLACACATALCGRSGRWRGRGAAVSCATVACAAASSCCRQV